MFLPIIGVQTPIENKTINLIETKPAVVEQIKELTIDQKIQSNFYKCNTDIQWIRADNAQCLDKLPTQAQTTPEQPRNSPKQVNTTSQGLNGYELGQCTGWVASHRYVPAGWGDATNWRQGAINAGWTVSNTPVVGAIAWRYGHVAYVIGVSGNTVTISEQNYDYHSSIRQITIPVTDYAYLYE